MAVSDSDYYLDMAAVLSGQKAAFDPVWSAAGHSGAHHYSRPLLPFLAGWLARVGVPTRVSFSVVNLIAAYALAIGLYIVLAHEASGLRHPWLPSALFLTGFPQIDWGYHILTDTLGLATAFLSAVGTWALMRWQGRERAALSDAGLMARLAALFALQTLAFLARETAWIVPIAVAVLIVMNPPGERRFAVGLLAVVLLAALPHALFVGAFGVERIGIPFEPRRWVAPGYILDAVVKSAAAFHFALPLAAVAVLRRAARSIPPLLVAWSVGALAYMVAGYAHNSLDGIGYPLRLTYALFPLVYYLAARGLESLMPGTRAWPALVAVGLNVAVGYYGTSIDRGASVTVPSLMRAEPRDRP